MYGPRVAEFRSVKAKDLMKILEREPLNYRIVRQKGSHRRMRSPDALALL